MSDNQMFKQILTILALLLPTVIHAQRTYSTNFSTTENPLSEGGNWTNGGITGIWCNVQTGVSGGIHYAFGVASSGAGCSAPGYNDPVAVLTGTWATTQHVKGMVFWAAGGPGPISSYPEVELRTNVTIAGSTVTGYEFDCGENPVGSPGSIGFAIVRWNGPLGNFPDNINNGFTVLAGNYSVPGCGDNDEIEAFNTGAATNNLQFWKNGVLMVRATDHTYTGGSPGIGMNAGTGASYPLSGWKSFSATDAAPAWFTLAWFVSALGDWLIWTLLLAILITLFWTKKKAASQPN
jgi:hypothetical protein